MERRESKSLEGIWTINAEGNTLFASESMAKLLLTCVEEMLGKSSFDFVFPEDLNAAQRLFGAKSRGDTKPFDFRLRRSDGTPIWMSVQGSPMYDATGAFNGLIGTFRVISKTIPEPGVQSQETFADS